MNEQLTILQCTPVCFECKRCINCHTHEPNIWHIHCKKHLADMINVSEPFSCSKFKPMGEKAKWKKINFIQVKE